MEGGISILIITLVVAFWGISTYFWGVRGFLVSGGLTVIVIGIIMVYIGIINEPY